MESGCSPHDRFADMPNVDRNRMVISCAEGTSGGTVTADSGVLVRPLLQSVAISPPRICDEQDIATIAQAFEAGPAALEHELAASRR
jgi:adenosylmethionine-8-amino-7-oxononanoate aminotransferase